MYEFIPKLVKPFVINLSICKLPSSGLDRYNLNLIPAKTFRLVKKKLEKQEDLIGHQPHKNNGYPLPYIVYSKFLEVGVTCRNTASLQIMQCHAADVAYHEFFGMRQPSQMLLVVESTLENTSWQTKSWEIHRIE